MRTLPFFVLLCLACGGVVPSVSGYQAQVDAMIGRPINDAVRVLGAPTRTVDLAGGTKMYVWEEKSEMMTPFHGTETRDENGNEHFVMSGRERVPLDCMTELEVDAAGTVTHTRTEGTPASARRRWWDSRPPPPSPPWARPPPR